MRKGTRTPTARKASQERAVLRGVYWQNPKRPRKDSRRRREAASSGESEWGGEEGWGWWSSGVGSVVVGSATDGDDID